MKILDRYLQNNVLHTTAIVAAAVAALAFVSQFISEADDIGDGDYGLFKVIQYVMLVLPDSLHTVFPVVALLGALLGLGAMAADRELVVIRSSGVSILRLAVSVARVGLILAACSLILGELLGPQGIRIGEQLRDRAQHGDTMDEAGDGLWLREGSSYVRISGTLAQDTMVDLTIYKKNDDGQITRITQAERARYDDARGWILEDARVSNISLSGVTVENVDRLPWDINISPNVLRLSVTKPDELSLAGLYRYIRFLEANKVASGQYRFAFWRDLVSPLTVLVLTVFALPFAFGQLRTAGAGQRLLVGGGVGLLFFMVNEIVASSAVVYGLPPWFAALAPTLALAGITVYWLAHLR
ncbi:MAG: LPS export ABC transporter permease LptG [Salinisphaeraceae bacterium]|nr:LPS export ABC transporter permease LptG [Salinisphaeraceae bacterium]